MNGMAEIAKLLEIETDTVEKDCWWIKILLYR